jgi:hypothetical protein
MTKPFVQFVDDTDENRILRDGEIYSCHMMMRDSITKSDAQIALDATRAVKMRDAAIHNAKHSPGFIRAAPVITDAMLARNAARAEYYDAVDRELENAWRGKAPVADATGDDPRKAWHDANNASRTAISRTTDAAAAQDMRDAAYAEVDAYLQNAWRNTRSL